MKTTLLPLVAVLLLPVCALAQAFSLQDFNTLYSLRGVWEAPVQRGLQCEQWEIKNPYCLEGRVIIVRDSVPVVSEYLQLHYQSGSILLVSKMAYAHSASADTFHLARIDQREFIFEHTADGVLHRTVYHIDADSVLEKYVELPETVGNRAFNCIYKKSHTASFEKRITGFWVSKTPTAEATMKWERDLQNRFLVMTYRLDAHPAAAPAEMFEGKAFYKNTGKADCFSAEWMDSTGDVFTVNGHYNGLEFITLWGIPEMQKGKSVYRFLDDQTIELADWRVDAKGGWSLFNRYVFRKTGL